MRSSIRFIGSSKDEVLEEEREVEALVELDRDEDGLHREVAAVGAAAVELAPAGHARRLAEVEEPRQAWPAGRQRAADQRLEEALAEDLFGRRPNSSSAGSDHLETAPCPSVRTKYPPTICRSSASSASAALRGTCEHGVGRARRRVGQGVHSSEFSGDEAGRFSSLNRQMQPFVQ